MTRMMNTNNTNNDSSNVTAIMIIVTDTSVFLPPLTSDHILWYFRLIVLGILGQAMAITGTVTNIINIIVFIKIGVRKDPMNISLLGLSISDLISCFTVIFLNLCLTPGFTENEDLPFTPVGAHYLFSSWPHLIFVKVTCCITAFITVERCLCVTFPLKIKQLLTAKRVAFITTFFFILILVLTAPIYHIYRMEWLFFPARNRTLYTLVFHEDKDIYEPPVITLFGVVVPFIAFFVTIVSTIILVYKLKQNAKWRNSVTNSTKTANPDSSKKSQITSKDSKVAKMVAVISGLYIACNLPVFMSVVAVLIVDELNEGEAYQNTLYVIFSINYFMESTNASLNIFIYLSMSTNYKTVFQKVFSKNRNLEDSEKAVNQ